MPTAAPLLATKLYISRARPASRLVSRPRLIKQLTDGLTGSLTLISVSAGFGKTTLISEWIHEGTKDEYGRMKNLHPSSLILQKSPGSRSTLKTTPQPLVHSIVTALINDLAGVPTSFAVVLDDYHFIVAASIHEALTFRLDHLAAQMHALITTRRSAPAAAFSNRCIQSDRKRSLHGASCSLGYLWRSGSRRAHSGDDGSFHC